MASRSACSLSTFKLRAAMAASFFSCSAISLRTLSVARVFSEICSNVSWMLVSSLYACRPTGSFLASLHVHAFYSAQKATPSLIVLAIKVIY